MYSTDHSEYAERELKYRSASTFFPRSFPPSPRYLCFNTFKTFHVSHLRSYFKIPEFVSNSLTLLSVKLYT